MIALTAEQKKWRWRILLSTYVGYGGYYLTRKVFTICKTSIADDFGWELGDTAHIWTAFLLAYMIGQFLYSYAGRKWGPRVILLSGLGVSIFCNAAFGMANSYATFITFMFVNGLVQASGWPGSVGAISRWLRSSERGFVMGIWSTNYVVGNIVVKSLGGYLLGTMGWQWSFYGCTLLTLGVWAILLLWQRNKPEDVGLAPIVDTEEGKDSRAVAVSQDDQVSFGDYLKILSHPLVLAMGASYFCIKFMRYALDSWLPAFLNEQGMSVSEASYYSMIFDYAGIAGILVTGWVLDRYFRGNWALLCTVMGIGAVFGYLAVVFLGTSPLMIAFSFGIVGFMIYGPDTLLCGAASVAVAGEANAVAVAGIVNGIGSFGPIVQEEVIGWLVRGDVQQGIRNTNLMTLSMSILFVCMMAVVTWRLHVTQKKKTLSDQEREIS